MALLPGGISTEEGHGAPRAKGCIRSWKPWTWRTKQGHIIGAGDIGPPLPAFGTPELQALVGWIVNAGNIASAAAFGSSAVRIPGSNFYWVSTNGAATWANAKSLVPLSGTACCSLATANANAQAGDVVYLRAGAYSAGAYIHPVHSGNAGSRISFQAYGSETVTISQAEYAILVDGLSYITVWDIDFNLCDRFMHLLNGASHNIVGYCNFDQYRNLDEWSGSRIQGDSTHNWVHHSRFSKYGTVTGTPPNATSAGVLFEIGDEESPVDFSEYNLIEDNDFYHAGHHVLGVNARYNVIRNNYGHHEAWHSGVGQRVVYSAGYAANAGWNLFENNDFAYSSEDAGGGTTDGMQISTSHNILRKNRLYFNNANGLLLSCSASYYQDVNYNHVYNNTFFANDQTDISDPANCAIYLGKWSGSWVIKYNCFKNNLYYLHAPHSVYGVTGSTGVSLADQTFANEYNGDVSGNPLFVNASATPGDPMDEAYPDLRLKAGSPCLNAGTALTTITSPGGTGTVFTVADAGYFMDGWGIDGVSGDEIQIIGTSRRATITNVNYSTNTITVGASLTWTQGQGIALSYSGTAPNAGAEDKYVIMAASPSFAHVQAAIASASDGDTVGVPAGSANWSGEFSFTKFINLMGAGSGQTHITSTYTSSDYMIYWWPDNPELDLPMRISGFDFNFANKCAGIHLVNLPGGHICHNVRIDHNILRNGTNNLIGIAGAIYGVADNNVLTQSIFGVQITDNHNSEWSWHNTNPEYGTANNFYFEDNVCTGPGLCVSGGQGNRYAFRYNTVTNTGDNVFWLFDMHGSYDDTLLSTMVAEIYENTINSSYMVGSLDQRGSMALFFNNTFNCAAVYMQVRNEYLTNVDTAYSPATSPDGSTKRVNRSYYWNNRNNGNLIYMNVPDQSGAGGTAYYSNLSPARWVPYPDKDFWTQNPNFNGSANLSQTYDNEHIGTVMIAGMGVGLLAARPASCAVADVGYWATDTNTLYRWHNGAWQVFYTPYTYPHPLRGE